MAKNDFRSLAPARRVLTQIIVLLSVLAAVLLLPNFSGYLQRPIQVCQKCNVILISLDSFRPDHTSLYGYARDTTPNIDRFAKSAFVFDSYFAASYLTPISEMSVHTGKYPFANGVINFQAPLKKDVKTMAQILHEQGYRTAAFGSSPEFRYYEALLKNFSRGFDRYEVAPMVRAPERPSLPDWKPIDQWLTKDQKPFFLWLAIGNAHWPYGQDAPLRFTSPSYRGPLRNIPLASPLLTHIDGTTLYKFRTENVTGWYGMTGYTPQPHIPAWAPKTNITLTADDFSYIKDRYDDGVRNADQYLQKLFSALSRYQLLQNTIVIIQSEHGEELGEHGHIAHDDIWEATTRVPLIIKNPVLAGDRRIPDLISGVDILPTLLDFLGIKGMATDGESFAVSLSGKSDSFSRREVFITRTPLFERLLATPGNPHRVREFITKDDAEHFYDTAIRTAEWKLIHRKARGMLDKFSWWSYLTGQAERRKEYELYNLRNDPGEHENILQKFPEIAKVLLLKLEVWELRTAPKENLPPQNTKEIQEYF